MSVWLHWGHHGCGMTDRFSPSSPPPTPPCPSLGFSSYPSGICGLSENNRSVQIQTFWMNWSEGGSKATLSPIYLCLLLVSRLAFVGFSAQLHQGGVGR